MYIVSYEVRVVQIIYLRCTRRAGVARIRFALRHCIITLSSETYVRSASVEVLLNVYTCILNVIDMLHVLT